MCLQSVVVGKSGLCWGGPSLSCAWGLRCWRSTDLALVHMAGLDLHGGHGAQSREGVGPLRFRCRTGTRPLLHTHLAGASPRPDFRGGKSLSLQWEEMRSPIAKGQAMGQGCRE